MAIKWSTKCSNLAKVIDVEALVASAGNNNSSNLIIRDSFHIKMDCHLEIVYWNKASPLFSFHWVSIVIAVMTQTSLHWVSCLSNFLHSVVLALWIIVVMFLFSMLPAKVDNDISQCQQQAGQGAMPLSAALAPSHCVVDAPHLLILPHLLLCHVLLNKKEFFPLCPQYPILPLDPPNVLAWIEQLVDLWGWHGRTVANQRYHGQRRDGLITEESVGKVYDWMIGAEWWSVIMMMIMMIVVVVVIQGGKGIMKHLHQAKTVTAAQTVDMGIVSESSSWVRKLQHSMAMLLQGEQGHLSCCGMMVDASGVRQGASFLDRHSSKIKKIQLNTKNVVFIFSFMKK